MLVENDDDGTWSIGRLVLDQMNRVLDGQARTMEEQSRNNERAARFAVGLVVAGIAVASLLLTLGWKGNALPLVVVVCLFGLFFVQSVTTAIGSIRLSTTFNKTNQIGVGPEPSDLLQGVRGGRYRTEVVVLKSLLVLAADLHPVNDERIRKSAAKRDRFVVWNISSVTWLAIATLIYVVGGWLW